MAESSWLDIDRTRFTFEPYFRGNDGHVDLAALGEWVESLPTKTSKDGHVSYKVDINKVPKFDKGDK